ncbi:MAG: trypsin-like peptidase domain-containing protein [Anaerohalosphaera sp.]|nr:trypsin-like peptidase domain-containing protein [Anaerohalosphaera sp.]
MRKFVVGLILCFIAQMSAGENIFTMAANENNNFEKSVVMLRCVQQDYDYVTPWKQKQMSQGIGSGFIIAGNRILTNAHNVANNKFVEVKKQNFAKRYVGKVVYAGHDCDLAIIDVAEPGFYDDMIALELGELPKTNSTVQTYGFPMGGSRISVTEGVVSRLQIGSYSHTQADSHLQVQTDAAINPGNSGGPVIQNGKVVGVAFQGMQSADNIGYMIPTKVIRHFLKDIEDKRYDGFGSFGFSMFAGLHNKAYADYLKVPAGVEGIVILSTQMNSSVENVLQSGDVVTKIEDYDIDNDGMITIYGLMLDMSEATEQKQIGEEVELTFYRNGEKMQAKVKVALNLPVIAYSVEFDKHPRYKIFAGLTFVPVSRNYLQTWGRTWITDLPQSLRYLFLDSGYLNDKRDRKEYVVLAEILADEINSYANEFKHKVLESINGIEILSLNDLEDAFEKTVDGFCEIKFMGVSTPLTLDCDTAMSRHAGILEKYEVPSDSYLEN